MPHSEADTWSDSAFFSDGEDGFSDLEEVEGAPKAGDVEDLCCLMGCFALLFACCVVAENERERDYERERRNRNRVVYVAVDQPKRRVVGAPVYVAAPAAPVMHPHSQQQPMAPPPTAGPHQGGYVTQQTTTVTTQYPGGAQQPHMMQQRY